MRKIWARARHRDNSGTVHAGSAGGRLALVALAAGAVCLGFSGILARLSEAGPAATGFWRMALVMPLFWLWMWRTDSPDARPATASRRGTRRLLMLAGVFFGLDIAFWHWSVGLTLIANATLFANLTPVVVALASVILFNERLKRLFLLGFVLAMTGSVLLSGAGVAAGGDGRHLLGDSLAATAAIFYGSYLLTVARLRGRVSTARVMAWSGFGAALTLLPIAILGGEALVPRSAQGWWTLITLALSAQFLGQTLIAYALAHLPAAFGALVLLIQPMVAALAAWLLLDEALTPAELGGMLTVMAGIAIARLSLGSLPSPKAEGA